MMKNKLRSQSGSTIITALLVLGLVSGTTVLLMQESQKTREYTKSPRIKSTMAAVESRIRLAAQNTSLLADCHNNQAGEKVCVANESFMGNLREASAPGSCAAGTPFCGVTIQNATVTPQTAAANVTRTFEGEIVYTGNDVNIASRKISIEIPGEVLSGSITCNNDTSPLLVGVDGLGNGVCRAMPTPCPAGQYVTNINWSTLTFQCETYAHNLGCSGDQYLSDFRWNGEDSYIVNCQARPTVANYFGFAPSYVATVVPPPAPTFPDDAPMPSAPPTTTTTTVPPTTTTLPATTTTAPPACQSFSGDPRGKNGLPSNIDRFHYDNATFTQICSTVVTGGRLMANPIKKSFDSPGDNQNTYWNGSAWINRGASASNQHFDTIACTNCPAACTPGDSKTATYSCDHCGNYQTSTCTSFGFWGPWQGLCVPSNYYCP